jgi:hypothetical protein
MILMIARGEKKKKIFAEEHTKALSHSLRCSQSSQAATEVKKGGNTTTSLSLDQFSRLLEDQDQIMPNQFQRKSKHRVLVERLIIRINSKINKRKAESQMRHKKMKMKILPKAREKHQEKRRDQDFIPKKEVPRERPKPRDKVITARSGWVATK